MTGASCLQSQHVNNRVCQAEYCTNKGKNCNLTFFMLSRDNYAKFEKWTRHIRLKPHAYALKKIYICSDHFELRYFTSTLRRHLVRDAYPTLQFKKPEEAAPDEKQVVETHFVWNNMPQSKNSRNSSSSSEDMHVIASLYLPSDGSKINEDVENLSEIDINQGELPVHPPKCHTLPVLWDKRFYEDRDEFLEEVIDHYMKKRYFSENEEENERLFQEKIDSLKDPNTLRDEWIAMKLAERYGPKVVAELFKRPSFIPDIYQKLLSEKSTKTCNIQNQVRLASPAESGNSTTESDLQCKDPSASTVQTSMPTNLLLNQKNSVSSSISDRHKVVLPNKTNKTCTTKNQVHLSGSIMVVSNQSENTTAVSNSPGCVSSTSTAQIRTVTNLVNQKSSSSSTLAKVVPEKAIKTCTTQNQVPLTGSVMVLANQSRNTTVVPNPPSCASSTSVVQMRTFTNLVNQKSPISSTINDKCKKVVPEKAIKTCTTQNQVPLTGSVMVLANQSKNTIAVSNLPSCASSTSVVQMRTLTNLVNQKSPISSTINDKGKKVVPEKTVETWSTQKQMPFTSGVMVHAGQSKNTIAVSNLPRCAFSTSVVQMKTLTNLVNQKSPIPIAINDKCKQVVPGKTCNTQNQVPLRGGIVVCSGQPKKTIVVSNPPSCASSTSIGQMRTLTNLVNQKSLIPSTIIDKLKKVVPEKTDKTCTNYNQVHLASADLSEDTSIDCDIQSSAPPTSAVHSKAVAEPVSQESTTPSVPSVQPNKVVMIPISTVLKLAEQKSFPYARPASKSKSVVDNLQNINPSANTKQSKNEVETSQPRKVMKLMSTNSDFSSGNLDHIYTKAIDNTSSTNCNLSEQQNPPQNKPEDDGVSERDCDSIAVDIANELKEIKDIQSRSEVLSKIQKLLEEAKSKACL